MRKNSFTSFFGAFNTISRTPTRKVNSDNQWWFGRNLTNGNGKMGLFPSNFIFIPRDIRQKFNITVKTAD